MSLPTLSLCLTLLTVRGRLTSSTFTQDIQHHQAASRSPGRTHTHSKDAGRIEKNTITSRWKLGATGNFVAMTPTTRMVIIDIAINVLLSRVTRHPAGMHCPSWDDAFVSSFVINILHECWKFTYIFANFYLCMTNKQKAPNWVRGPSRSLEMSPCDIVHTTSYWRSAVAVALSRVVSKCWFCSITVLNWHSSSIQPPS